MQMYSRIAGLVVCLLLSGSVWVSAQFQKPDANAPSPNAASLGQYGHVPVSLYTGTPNVNIPLYTVEEGNIKVPISLSYHASGVRVNQHPGWVGLNWNLNAGGVITRSVRDVADDVPYVGYYDFRTLYNVADWNTASFFKRVMGSEGRAATDTEPDEYSFNFGEYSGTFYLASTGEFKVRSDVKMKVELLKLDGASGLFTPEDLRVNFGRYYPPQSYTPVISEYPITFKGFAVTTPDGMRYEFGGSSNSIEYSVPFLISGRNHGLLHLGT